MDQKYRQHLIFFSLMQNINLQLHSIYVVLFLSFNIFYLMVLIEIKCLFVFITYALTNKQNNNHLTIALYKLPFNKLNYRQLYNLFSQNLKILYWFYCCYLFEHVYNKNSLIKLQ